MYANSFQSGLAGSLMLNHKFEHFVKTLVDEEQFFSLRKTNDFRHAMKQFDEEIKPDFTPSSTKKILCQFPRGKSTKRAKSEFKGKLSDFVWV
jgi:hypothetical protein